MFVFGKPALGKSATVKAFLLRMMDFGYRALILGDPKDEYEQLCRALGVEPIRIGPGQPARINPLAFGPAPMAGTNCRAPRRRRGRRSCSAGGSPWSGVWSAANASVSTGCRSVPPMRRSSRRPWPI
jgi:hypothetical protein